MFKVICAWCGILLRNPFGVELSHGIYGRCMDAMVGSDEYEQLWWDEGGEG